MTALRWERRAARQREATISSADDFKTLFSNIAINNEDTIALRYGEVTRACNLQFRDTDSRTANSLQVGSYGRWTGIRGISDLDMLYLMPSGKWDAYKNNPYKLLRDTADAIQARYTTTEVYVDTLVVVCKYQNFKVEVQPVFEDADGFWYPYTKNGGCYRLTKPRGEINAIRTVDANKNGNLRRLCKMTRAWKNKHGVAMNGLVIDTLAHNFLLTTKEFDNTAFSTCGQMMRDFLEFLSNQPKQERYHALGSGQHVKVHKRFEGKAKKGLELADKACAAGEENKANNRWRKLFGNAYPLWDTTEVEKTYITEASYTATNTEELIEDKFPVDIRYSLRLECEVKQNGFRTILLRAMRGARTERLNVYRSKSLKFYIAKENIKGSYQVYWKVLNRGLEAVRLDKIRGQIETDSGSKTKNERSNFRGEHVVDCYAVQDGVVVAKDRIHVPIVDESES